MGAFTAREACSGYLTDARVAVPDLLDVLTRLRRDLIGLDEPPLEDRAAAFTRRRNREAALAARIADLITDSEAMPVAEEVECGFDGEIDDVHYHRMAQVVSWQCPRCGTDREEDVDTEPDPDDARDAMRDRMAEDWR